MNRKLAKKPSTPDKKHLAAQQNKALKEIERLAEHALDSGPLTPLTSADFEEMRRKLRAKYGVPNGKAQRSAGSSSLSMRC